MSERLRRALHDWQAAEADDFDTVPMEEVARELAREVETFLGTEDDEPENEPVRVPSAKSPEFLAQWEKLIEGFERRVSDFTPTIPPTKADVDEAFKMVRDFRKVRNERPDDRLDDLIATVESLIQR